MSVPINNAASRLASAHLSGSNALVLREGEGDRFGGPTADEPIRVTVVARSTLVNGQIAPTSTQTIFLCTARVGDTLSGLTAIEGTADQNFGRNDPVASLITAGTLAEIQAGAALPAGTEGETLVAGADGVPVFEAKATSAQASLSSLAFVACGDSQTAGYGLDDPDKQSWPALVGQLAGTVDNRGISGQVTAGILADLLTVANRSSKSFTLEGGRNDYGTGVPAATTKANIQSMVAAFGSSRFIIKTIPFRSAETTGAQAHTDVDALNQWILSTYPDNSLDVMALYAANVDPTNAGDVADNANGVIPRSYRLDDLHRNAAGHRLEANAVLKMLAILAPDSAPVLEPKSLANINGELAIKGSTAQGNAWVGNQEFKGNATVGGTTTLGGTLTVLTPATGTMLALGANTVANLLVISYDVTSAGGVGVTGGPFGSLDVASQNNKDIRFVPHGTGKARFIRTGSGVIGAFGVVGATDLLVFAYDVTVGGAVEVTSSPFGPLILATQSDKDIQLAPHGTGKVSVTKALAVTGNLGVNGTTPVAKGTITGSRSDGTALANLLTYLASRGDLTDSSSA